MNSLETELRITAKRPSSPISRNDELEKLVQKNIMHRKRLLCLLKSFLSEHTLFPVSFKFEGKNLIGQLKEEITRDKAIQRA